MDRGGEKNTSYFLHLEKRNSDSKFIKKLIDKDNKEMTDLNDIISEQQKFYEDLYKTKLNNNPDEHFLNNNNIPTLSELEKNICDNPLSIEIQIQIVYWF